MLTLTIQFSTQIKGKWTFRISNFVKKFVFINSWQFWFKDLQDSHKFEGFFSQQKFLIFFPLFRDENQLKVWSWFGFQNCLFCETTKVIKLGKSGFWLKAPIKALKIIELNWQRFGFFICPSSGQNLYLCWFWWRLFGQKLVSSWRGTNKKCETLPV